MKATLPAVALLLVLAGVPGAHAQDAAALQARHAALHDALARNAFQRPLHLESREESSELTGEVHARVAQPYAVVGPALQGMSQWCDILMLHLNVKACRARGDTLTLSVGRKFDQPLADAYRFEFRYEVAASRPDYLRVVLSAAQGPFGTSGYRIVLEAAPLDGARSFLHLSYAYSHGLASRWAARAYLATIGRSKVGFSIVGRRPDGQPVYIGSTRGMIERNAMRFYLAIEAYLAALSAPLTEQVERRLHGWHAGVEQYSVQLHELDLAAYLAMKRVEIRRQQAPDVSPSAQINPSRSATLVAAPAPGATRPGTADVTRSSP